LSFELLTVCCVVYKFVNMDSIVTITGEKKVQNWKNESNFNRIRLIMIILIIIG